jgi:ribosome recycling factor
MTEELNLVYNEFKEANAKTLTHLDNELQKIRAGKATPSMLSSVMVEYYGMMTPIQQVGAISVPDGRTITIQAFEKNMLNEIQKAIINSNLGFAPSNNGEMLIISLPPLTEERRKDMVKKSKGEAEHAKVGVRNNRKDAIDMIKMLKTDGLSEDLVKDAETEIQKITDVYARKVDEIVDSKEKDIMTI